MSSLNIENLLKIALQLEREGVKFFNRWSELAETEELQMFFSMLAEEEEEHVRIFLKIAADYRNSESEVEISSGLQKFYKKFSSEVLYNDAEFESVTDMKQALEKAKKQEIDAQLFYSELRKHINKSHHGIVDRIISEEQKHYKKISDLQKTLNL